MHLLKLINKTEVNYYGNVIYWEGDLLMTRVGSFRGGAVESYETNE